MAPRVLAYVMARDEWPLLALSIAHVLASVRVDHVAVLDHASSDGTAAGLARIQHAFPDRVTVMHLDDPAFMQAATTYLAMAELRADGFDWVYVFDSDEFLLLPEGATLQEILGDVPQDIDAVQYEVHNWLAPHMLQEHDIASYRNVVHRAVVRADGEGHKAGLAVIDGAANYFDFPFADKVIVRGSRAKLISAGAHRVGGYPKATTMRLGPEVVRSGHLPYLSRERLSRKSRIGKAHRAEGRSRGHGWQNQMLDRVEADADLDSFWARHSVPAAGINIGPGYPEVVEDTDLQRALDEAISVVRESGTVAVVAPNPVESTDPVQLSPAARQAVDELLLTVASARAELRSTRAELRSTRAELRSTRAELRSMRNRSPVRRLASFIRADLASLRQRLREPGSGD